MGTTPTPATPTSESAIVRSPNNFHPIPQPRSISYDERVPPHGGPSATSASSPAVDTDTAGLLARAQGGDQQAFAELVSAQRDRMWAICLRITGNATDAEDALQESLVAAWRALPRFRGDARLSTWLFRIASNAALAQIRRRAITSDIDDVELESATDIAGQVVVADRIAEALAQLPDAYRATFVLRVYGDLSYAEIAEAQGIGLQTVRSRISRARTILSELLADLR